MMRKIKKAVSLLLVFCMVFGLTTSVFATETESPLETTAEETQQVSTEESESTVESTEAPEEQTEENVETTESSESDESMVYEAKAAVLSLENDEEETAVTPTAEARSTTGDDFYKIVHLDAGRKYFSPENIKKIIDNAAAAGFNQVELYLSDNQGFRFALDDMDVTTSTGNTYDLTPALGDGYSDGSKYSDGSGKYLTQSEMTDIISYAAGKGIDIVPCINVPGHMGAILEEFTHFKYSGSNSSIDLENAEAVAFALAITEKYATYFESQGVKFYNLGADEYANDLSTMGFQGLYTSGKYQKFVDFLNSAAQIVINHGMTPRAFNDGIYYNENNTYSINSAIQVCYWSCGWSGYNLASAQYLVNQGMNVINTHGDYYWVLGNSSWQCNADKASQFDYTSFQYRSGTTGNGTISDPAGAMFCIWCDVGSADGKDDGAAVASATKDVITAFGAALPASETGNEGDSGTESGGDSGDAGDVEVTEFKTVTVTVGKNETATIDKANYAGTYTTEDPSIATVEVTGKDATEATTTYTQASVRCNTLISSNSNNWTAVSGYYYKADDGNYYPVYAKRSSSWSWSSWTTTYTYTWGYSTTSNASNVTQIGTQSTTDTSTTPNITVYTKSDTAATPASTTVTFTGVAVGTTYVTVGNTRYTINVVAEDLSKVNPLTVELWITNSKVYVSQDTSSASTVEISAKEAYGENGVQIGSFVPEEAYSNYDGWLELHFWQAMCLDSSNYQTTDSGDDETADGTAFSKVRYYNSEWQYMISDNTWQSFESDDQTVAYYMRHTEITKEITTAMKDWGYGTDTTTPDTSSNKGQVALTVAVVYPDGTVSPAEDNMYANSTTIFNYWENRNIGIIAPLNNSDYEISKITVTDGTRTDNTTSNTWDKNSTIEWNKTTNAAGSEWYDETEVWIDTMDTEPMVNGSASNIVWSAKNTAKLILIYLKPVHHESNLTVQWVDDSAGGALISSQEVVVAYDGVDDPITFLNGLKQESDVKIGSITLDDNAYITNSSGVNQTFNKDITTIQGVAGQYTSGLYEYTGADISEDGKILTLHYNLNSENLTKQYVVDFGLPVDIPLTDLIDNTNNVKNVVVSSNASYNNNVITYTPSQILNGVEAVTARVEYTSGSPTTFSIGFIPATTVYYEEGFATLTGFSGGSKGTKNQSTESVGNKQNNYGYDDVYKNEGQYVGPSNGTEATSTSYGDKAEFTFTGTGVDIYTNSTTSTGQLFIQVKNSTGRTVKMVQVKTALLNGATDSTNKQEVIGYNVPVASLDLETNDTYTVIITHRKPSSEAEKDTVNLDGFRVYGTLDLGKDVYVQDKEDNPSYIEVRDQVLAGLSVTSNGNGQINAELPTETNAIVVASSDKYTQDNVDDLLNNGPKNEIYLQPKQSLVFKITTNREVQIGLRALNEATSYTMTGRNGDQSISSGTDMFYTVLENWTADEQTITITNSGSGILAITKLKICDDPNATLGTLTTEDLTDALVALGITETEPIEPEEPEVIYADATLTVQVNDEATILTKNGVIGESAMFTAAEVQAAAEALVADGYELKDVTYSDVTVAYGEENTVTFTATEKQQTVDTPDNGNSGSSSSSIIDIFNKLLNALKNILGRK